ncbi:MAG: bifunctional phosphoglucose/phosphomannose isomerase [Aquificota bacterium]|nr:bifunctional phosphoglucose/phosphomannose isomerase [Aquificota bacterium]
MIESLPDQIVWEDIGEDVSRFSRVLICGMGGSGIVGDIARSWAEHRGVRVPVLSYRGYGLPPWAEGKETLVICVSYSGNTEETISNLETALRRGCYTLAVSSGGKLEEIAEEMKIKHFKIPGGYAPRYALGFMLSKVLSLLGIDREEIEDARENLRDRVRESEERGKDLAERVYGYIPLIYATPLTEAVAFRWKTQINENSKTQAYFATLPELHHNEVVGLDNAEVRSRFFFLLLFDPKDHHRVKLRVDITAGILKDLGIVPEILSGEGNSYLARTLHLIYTGDWTSYYLALRYRFDPLPVKVIDRIKERLSEIK